MYTKQQILEIAMSQSAIDLNCSAQDFLKEENRIVRSAANERARKYLALPFLCNLVSYGNNIVASVSQPFEGITWDYINRFSSVHCFETPNLHILDDALFKQGARICFMAEYFLPDPTLLTELPCPYEIKQLTPADFRGLYLPQWSNALCEKRKELDVLAVGAYDGKTLIGLAGCSADCEMMWQIGIDVLPAYRKQGVASALTARLALEILKRDKVPFYCAAWSNIRSVRNAARCGFRPAWVEMTAKPIEFIDELNRT